MQAKQLLIILLLILPTVFNKVRAQGNTNIKEKTLYFKTSFGFVARTMKYSDVDSQTGDEFSSGKIKGTGYNIDLQLGDHLAKAHILAIDLNYSNIPTSKFSGNDVFFDPDYELFVHEFNLGLTYLYRFLPSGFHISGTPAWSVIGFVRNSERQKSNYGFSFGIEGGKTWPIAEGQWRFGCSASYRYTRTKTGYKDADEILISQPLSVSAIIGFN
ncbi:MAG: hypothetical protein ABI723_19290 [Bacteroidia bacterium]